MSASQETNSQFAVVAEQVADTIQREANVDAVFGEPIKLESHTIVPVATILVSIGGGAGGTKGEGKMHLLGGGAGLGVTIHAKPLGVISEKDGEVRFIPIEVPNNEPGIKSTHPKGWVEEFVGHVRALRQLQ